MSSSPNSSSVSVSVATSVIDVSIVTTSVVSTGVGSWVSSTDSVWLSWILSITTGDEHPQPCNPDMLIEIIAAHQAARLNRLISYALLFLSNAGVSPVTIILIYILLVNTIFTCFSILFTCSSASAWCDSSILCIFRGKLLSGINYIAATTICLFQKAYIRHILIFPCSILS